MLLRAPAFLAVGLLALLLARAASAATLEDAMEFGGRKRWWLVHAPAAGGAAGPRPLVLVLHGGGGTPHGAERMSDMNALADREGFIAVFPAGTGLLSRHLLTWNSGNCCGWAMKGNVDDVGFLSALIDKYVQDGRADPKRVFATGLSNGAMMAHRLACERADLLAAIAPVAGAIGIPRCAPSRPVSVLMIHGRGDEYVPYEGGSGRKSLERRVDRSVAEDLEIWTEADACRPSGSSDGVVSRRDYACRDGAAVELLTHAGGHIWPGGHEGLFSGNVDPVLPEPKATEVIWDFFNSHPRR